ncbi:MAG: glucose 1-dehydrogenase [Actinomycetota bacterium]|nr:glucose 1-dehydrogenase [Actinomycetota bacterium]
MPDHPDPRDRFLLTDKVALVTGGSRGLGREMVKAFAAVGAHVIIASRKLENCQELADEIMSTTDRQAMAYGCHVGDWGQLDGLVDMAYERFGRIDVLVNNAGMSPLYESLAGHTEALYDKVFDVNLKGPFRLMANVGTRMAEGAGGSIINVSSGGAVRPGPTILPYSAAKAGLNAMTIGFAHAFGPKVRVNCIQAGPFLTDISKAWDLEAVKAHHEATFAMQRPGNPDEVIGAALYFASDASSWTTGAILPVDGGMP